MNNGVLIKKYFDFLCKHSFKRKLYTNGSDYEVYYEKGQTKLGVSLSLTMLNKNVNQYIQKNHYTFPSDFDKDKFIKEINSSSCSIKSAITIVKNGKGENLLTCSLFDGSELNLLSEAIKNCGMDYEKQLEIYRSFIKNNLEKIE